MGLILREELQKVLRVGTDKGVGTVTSRWVGGRMGVHVLRFRFEGISICNN